MDEEEDMDYEEATDAAMDRRKFLLNKIFQPQPVLKNEEEEEEEEEKEEDKEMTKKTKKLDLETKN